MGYHPELPALQGFGYRQMVDYLQGRLSLDAAIADYQAATRRYIRRQQTWFRRQPAIQWIEAGPQAQQAALQHIGSWLEER
jgi:tRNA dimethylallyltransferase